MCGNLDQAYGSVPAWYNLHVPNDFSARPFIALPKEGFLKANHATRYKEKVLRRRKIFIFVTLLVFFTILANALFGASGILVNMQVQAEHRKLQQQQEVLRVRNQQLQQEILALQTNPRKIEALGRKEYGFARPGEIVFIFPDDPSAPIQKIEAAGAPESPGP